MSQVWLIGDPVAHSLSPAMHNAAFAALGLPHRYEAREVKAEQLAATLERMRQEDVLGANVTIPHKEAVLRLVARVSDEARRIGAVNTITRHGGLLHAARPTPRVKRSRATENVTVVDGLSMLLHQAARSFQLWTGLEPPVAVMRAALPRPV